MIGRTRAPRNVAVTDHCQRRTGRPRRRFDDSGRSACAHVSLSGERALVSPVLQSRGCAPAPLPQTFHDYLGGEKRGERDQTCRPAMGVIHAHDHRYNDNDIGHEDGNVPVRQSCFAALVLPSLSVGPAVIHAAIINPGRAAAHERALPANVRSWQPVKDASCRCAIAQRDWWTCRPLTCTPVRHTLGI